MSEFFTAIARNDAEGVSRLLQGAFDPNARDEDGRTAIMYAAIGGSDELVNLLVEHRADVNAQDGDGFSPLHFAAQNFHVAVAEALLRAGADVNAMDRYGNTPLWRAVFSSRGRGEMIQLLLGHGADSFLKNLSGKSPADLAATVGNYDVKRFFAGL